MITLQQSKLLAHCNGTVNGTGTEHIKVSSKTANEQAFIINFVIFIEI